LFLRLGFEGYRAVQQASQDVAKFLAAGIAKLDAFELWNDGSDIPVFAWRLKDGHTENWTLYDLQDRLRMRGWLVPAYPMPADLEQITVQRIVVRNGLSMDLASDLLDAITAEVAHLDALTAPMPGDRPDSAFHH
jgi:glutamate decarboxylase